MIHFPSYQITAVLQAGARFLKQAGIESADLDARLLLQKILNRPREFLVSEPQFVCSASQVDHYKQVLERRASHEPVAKIIGMKEFWGLPFAVNDKVLDPRPDSETLIEAVLEHFKDRQFPYSILDLGVGSGCLLLSLLHEFPNCRGVGIDISPDALAIAQRNAQNLNLNMRVQFECSSWGQNLDTQFDIVITNPPYIRHDDIATLSKEVKNYDPLLALSGGDDGLACYRLIAPQVRRLIKPNGLLFIEIGQGQEDDIETLFNNYDFILVKWKEDLRNIKRCGIFKMNSFTFS